MNSALADFAAYQRATNLAETTVRNRESILRTLERKAAKPLLELDIVDLRRYLGRPGMAAGTRRTERSAMRAFFGFLAEEERRDDDPTVKLAAVHAPKGEPRPFSAAQVDAMLASGAYRKTRAMILIGYYQGFRVSQIARVHGHDVDVLGESISTIGKGNKSRTLPLHPLVAELAATMPTEDWWFPARGGRTGHVHASSVTDRITRAKKRAGIHDPRLTPHSLRHAFGTDLVEEGVDIRIVRDLMTHESLATTEIYTGVSIRRKREGILALPSRPLPTRSGRKRIAA